MGETVPPVSGLDPLAVFDIDGVLADVRHRLHHVERSSKDWDAFFAAAPRDPALEAGVALAQEAARDCDLVYLTGRPERCRRDTEGWLRDQELPTGLLVMRGTRDRRPASRLKPALLAQAARGRVVAIVVDDDPAVCAAYEAAGWPVHRAGWVEQFDALSRAQEQEGRT